MKLDEFYTAIDGIVIDPRPQIKMATSHTIAHTLGADIPADLRERLCSEPLRALFAAVENSIEAGHYSACEGHLSAFRSALAAAVADARQFGELKPWSAADQIARCAAGGLWHTYHWNGFEVRVIQNMLMPNESIAEVTYRTVRTDQRTITRDDLRAAAAEQRPAWTRDERLTDGGIEFARNFTSEHSIQEEEARAAHVARPVVLSGPRHMIGQPVQ